MFDSLAEQIRHDDQLEISSRERALRWLAVAVLSIVVFGGVFVSVNWLQ